VDCHVDRRNFALNANGACTEGGTGSEKGRRRVPHQ
jgi:hypothetical protein